MEESPQTTLPPMINIDEPQLEYVLPSYITRVSSTNSAPFTLEPYHVVILAMPI
jgi:hypothetical protein